MDMPHNYIAITPVRDEEHYIEKTIGSVAAQTILPLRYVIVDDGSHDATGEIIDRYARRYPWLTALHRPDRGYRNSAGGEIDAFYFGLKSLPATAWDFIIKLDGDMSFDKDYFERLMGRFAAEPNSGLRAV